MDWSRARSGGIRGSESLTQIYHGNNPREAEAPRRVSKQEKGRVALALEEDRTLAAWSKKKPKGYGVQNKTHKVSNNANKLIDAKVELVTDREQSIHSTVSVRCTVVTKVSISLENK